MVPKILLVEDHADSAHVMAALLRRSGYEVIIAATYRHALEVARIERPGLLLCDIGLPDGDGCDLLFELKQESNIIGLAVSGNAYEEDRQRYLTAGFADCIVKPCTIDEIIQAIERVCLIPPSEAPPKDLGGGAVV